MTGHLIRSIEFDADGSLAIEYCHPVEDMKATGVVCNHVLGVPVGDQYDEEITAVHDAVHALLLDVLEDLPFMPPMPEPDADDDAGDDADDDPDDEGGDAA